MRNAVGVNVFLTDAQDRHCVIAPLQGCKIIYFLMGPWDPWAMILMGPRALGMGPIIDVFINWKYYDALPGHW